MAQKAALDELLQYVRILILDDDVIVGQATQVRLQQNGFPFVEFTPSTEKAWEYLSTTNILLVDHYLTDQPQTGTEFTHAAKERFGANLDVIIYSGSVEKLAQAAKESGATACLEKPLNFDYLLLWIQETARRIWMERILDAVPDELIIIDPRQQEFGKIHYANKAKRDRFEKDRPLLYDYCWRRFERQDPGDGPCSRCPSRDAMKERQIVRALWDYVDWEGKQESVDLYAAPIFDQTGEIRGIIETCRDRTTRRLAQWYVQRIEEESSWQARLELFLEGFRALGYPLVRFYKKTAKEGAEVFQGIRQIGTPPPFDINTACIDMAGDRATQILLKERHPVLFIVKPNMGFEWAPSSVYPHVYRVDDRLVPNNEVFKKKRWVDVPVMAYGEIIAKVSADPGETARFISGYELDVLRYYASWAGQALANAEQQEKLRLTSKTNELIIHMNQQISRRPLDQAWLYRALGLVCEVLQASACSFFVLSGKGVRRRLVRKSNFARDIHGNKVEKYIGEESYRIGQYLVGSVFKSGKNTVENNMIEKAEMAKLSSPVLNLKSYHDFGRQIGEPIRNAMFVVLRSRGQKFGVIRVINKNRSDIYGNRDFTDHDMKAFQALAGQIALAYETFNLVRTLKESKRVKEEIAALYSHTLKNLLQPVVTYFGLLRREPNNEEYWNLLDGVIARMKTTINTMLRLTQAETVGLTRNDEPVNIETTLAKVERTYRFLANDKGMNIRLLISPDVPTVLIDKELVQDAVANLLDNAIKYGEEAKPIVVSARMQGASLIISVLNYGKPIPKADQTKVFEKYYTTQLGIAKKVKQFGLGLAFVKAVAESYAGKAYVDGRFNQGAKIILKLKVHIVEEAQ